jgi:anti-sigma B factor antagonist
MVRPNKFEITEATGSGTQTVAISGELDLSTVPALAQRIDALGDRIETLILDLRDLSFMDSSGLRLLIELNQRAQQEAWELLLIPSRHESAKIVLRMTGADAALPFVYQSPS